MLASKSEAMANPNGINVLKELRRDPIQNVHCRRRRGLCL